MFKRVARATSSEAMAPQIHTNMLQKSCNQTVKMYPFGLTSQQIFDKPCKTMSCVVSHFTVLSRKFYGSFYISFSRIDTRLAFLQRACGHSLLGNVRTAMPASSSRPSALRPLCQWSEGCPNHARKGGFCARHSVPAASGDVQSAPRNRPPALPNAPGRKKRRVGGSARATALQSVSVDNYRDQDVLTLSFGAMSLRCTHCRALFFAAERNQSGKFTLCCKNGKASNLPGVSEAPEPLRSYLLGTDPAAKLFRQHIRRYNAAMSFVSFGANVEIKSGNSGTSAPPVCIVHGAVYHHSYPLRASDAEEPKFAQFYLYDTLEATQLRNNRDRGLQADILAELDYMLHTTSNPYVDAYRRMGELTNNLDPAVPQIAELY